MAAFLTVSLAVGILGGCGQTAADTADAKEVEITNVSYDPTRVRGVQCAVCGSLEEADRTGCVGHPVTWRLRQAGT